MALTWILGYKIFRMPATPQQIHAIAFDLGGVLVKVDHDRFCRGLAPLGAGPLEKVYAAIFGSDLEAGYDTGHLSSREFYQRVRGYFGLALTYPKFCALWNGIFDPMEGMAETVARLQQRYPLFLVSNTNPLHFRYVRQRFPLLGHFRRFILSFQVGSRKPEPGIYQALIREVGQPPRRCLYVDDQLPFVEAARNHGLVSWHFTSPRDFQGRLSHHGLW
jgi:HAD superfamily hydrolase (TIGR01509 family)